MNKGRVLFAWIASILLALPRVAGSADQLPMPMGCFQTSKEEPALPNFKLEDSINMNQNLCVDYCTSNEQTFAGLQKGSICWCSEVYPQRKAPDSYCKDVCAGNRAELCGSENGVVVFAVCDEIHYGPKCDLPCMCADNYVCDFMTGHCLNKKCQSGWKGDRCDHVARSTFGEIAHKFVEFINSLGKKIKSWFVLTDNPPEKCDAGRFGIWCKSLCHCQQNTLCDRLTGVCDVKECALGWLGKRCDKPNPCGSNPCENGGTCQLNGFSMHCVCTYPYSGSNCELVDPCFRGPCFNRGICLSNGSIFSCDCQGDFGGDMCELVLKSLPQTQVYLGCFREVESERDFIKRLLDLDERTMTPTNCVIRCKAKRYTYAALQVGNQCWCSNSYARYGAITEKSCNQQCPGDRKATCGARNANSVYAVCGIGSYKADCKGVCNCFAAQCELATGMCPNPYCKVGYQGPKCDQANSEKVEKYKNSRRYITYVLAFLAAFTAAQSGYHVATNCGNVNPEKPRNVNPEEPQNVNPEEPQNVNPEEPQNVNSEEPQEAKEEKKKKTKVKDKKHKPEVLIKSSRKKSTLRKKSKHDSKSASKSASP